MGSSVRVELGKYLLDISKLTFGGVFLSGIVNVSASVLLLVGIGAVAVICTAAVGFLLTK